MAGLLDLLLASSQTPSPNSQIPPQQNSDGSTTVSPIDLVAKPSSGQSVTMQAPKSLSPITQQSVPPMDLNQASVGQYPIDPSQNYDNSSSVQAIANALKGDSPQGGSTNPGIYGLLPQNLQHGTLRNVLGALGDAFLVGSNRQPTYAPNMQRQAEGNALAGYDQNPQAAIQRLAATGAPGSADLAAKLEEQRQMMEYNQQYRQQMISARNEGILQRGQPVAMGIASSATSPEDYAQKYQLLTNRAKAIDPSMDAASAFGIPTPDEWKPGIFNGYGMTSNQQQVSSDKAAQRGVSERNTDVNANARVQAAGVGAGGHIQAAGIAAAKPTEGTILEGLIQKQNSGQRLSPAEQAIWAKYSTAGRGGARAPLIGTPGGAGTSSGGNIPIQNYGANNPVANNGRPLSAAQASSLPKGTHFLGNDGNWYIR